jgi:hypothetical protein
LTEVSKPGLHPGERKSLSYAPSEEVPDDLRERGVRLVFESGRPIAQVAKDVRQLKDWKASAEIEQMNPEAMARYGTLCGWTLARAHARSGDRIALAAYLGNGDSFDRALVEFSKAYADQNDRDYRAPEGRRRRRHDRCPNRPLTSPYRRRRPPTPASEESTVPCQTSSSLPPRLRQFDHYSYRRTGAFPHSLSTDFHTSRMMPRGGVLNTFSHRT